jgi:CPA1 family monovalent cation:H+ antiporter
MVGAAGRVPIIAGGVTLSAHSEILLCLLLVAGAALLTLAPILGVPYPILLVLGGFALGFIPGQTIRC